MILPLLLAALAFLLLSCNSTKSTVSASVKNETVAYESDRLSSSLMGDSFSKFFTLSVDSMVIILAQREIFPTHKGPQSVADSGNASSRDALDDAHFHKERPPADSTSDGGMKPATEQPQALKIYGLQVGASTDQKYVLQSSSEDSEAKATQSSHEEEEQQRKSAPSNAPKYLFYIILIALAIGIFYKLRS